MGHAIQTKNGQSEVAVKVDNGGHEIGEMGRKELS